MMTHISSLEDQLNQNRSFINWISFFASNIIPLHQVDKYLFLRSLTESNYLTCVCNNTSNFKILPQLVFLFLPFMTISKDLGTLRTKIISIKLMKKR